MSSMNRRKFLSWGLQVRKSRGTDLLENACVDPNDLSDSVVGMRESLDYTDTSVDTKTVCGGCNFFKPKTPSDACAYCEVLQSPVSATGHCVSWTKRA